MLIASTAPCANSRVVRAVIAAGMPPVSAEAADIFGRVELLYVSVLLYVIGTIIESVSKSN